HMPKAIPEKSDVADVVVKVQVTGQKQGRRRDRRNHAGAMSGEFAAQNQVAADEQQGGAGPVQACDEAGKIGVLLGNHAAGLVVLRLTSTKHKPNISAVASSSAAIEVENDVTVGLSGYSNPRNASTP